MTKHTKIGIFIVIGYFVLTASECKKATDPDSTPYITNKEPSGYTLNQKIGDTINFLANATDADDDPIEYKTLMDGIKVSDTNTFEFIVDEIGSFLIQIIAYNTEADTAEWQVNVENQAPVINSLGNVIEKEDEIIVGSIVHTLTISDNEDSLEDLVLELSQTNSDLIQLALDGNNIIVESYQADGNGSSEITIQATDTYGTVSEETFTYNINPMTDISGTILDSDTWEANTSLQGWIIIDGDTTWTDEQCIYVLQIEPTSSIDIEAGYRSLDKSQPMSFITTARNIGANNDKSGADIMVVTYLNNNMTPDEFRILAWETNFRIGGNTNYTGSKVPSKDMVDYILITGASGDVFTASELNDLRRVKNDSINAHLKYPPSELETNYYDGIYNESNITIWEKEYWGNSRIGARDWDSDGIVDRVRIITDGDHPNYYDSFISNLLEEGFSGRGMFGPPTDPILEGKTLVYEYRGVEWVHDADIKFIKFIEGVAHEVGYLKPKMPLDDVFKIQE